MLSLCGLELRHKNLVQTRILLKFQRIVPRNSSSCCKYYRCENKKQFCLCPTEPMVWVIICVLFDQDIEIPDLPEDVKAAFDVAYNNIKLFHAAQEYQPLEVETMPGVVCRRVARPIGTSFLQCGYDISNSAPAYQAMMLAQLTVSRYFPNISQHLKNCRELVNTYHSCRAMDAVLPKRAAIKRGVEIIGFVDPVHIFIIEGFDAHVMQSRIVIDASDIL